MSDFSMHSLPARLIGAHLGRAGRMAARTLIPTASAALLVGLAGCGGNMKPTVTPILGTGPASQPTASAFVVSRPISSSSANGYGTVIDYSGDTIMATAAIGPGPKTFAGNSGGTEAWTLNEDTTLSNIPVSTDLQPKLVTYSTLTPYSGVDPVISLYSGSLGLYALDVNLNQVDVLTGTPSAFNRDVPVDTTPITAVGVSGATRFFTISQEIPYTSCAANTAGTTNCTPATMTLDGTTVDSAVACNIDPHSANLKGYVGFADGIETATYTRSSQIPVGVCPVYAVATPDTRRLYVLNRGSDTISVINSQNNDADSCVCPPTGCVNQNGAIYTCHPTIPLSTTAVTATGIQPVNSTTAKLPTVAGPVYAEYNSATEQLVVSNYDGNTVNIIDVSLDEYGNDSSTFGTTYTVPVGKNPASVTVLADGSRAYTANQTDGTVTIVNIASHSVETTLPVTGNPRSVSSIQNSEYGKVYVVSPNSPTVTIIRTDQDIIDTTILTQGDALDVRVSSPDTSSANANLTSRLPGAGQPCFLPPSTFTSAAPLTLANCQAQDPSLLTASTI
jgi:YVTN family beta-propeller protein